MTTHKPSQLLYHIKAYQLMLCGLILLITSLILHHEVHIDSHLYELITKLIGEVGGLFLVVGVLHWMFEHGVRQEMLKEISEAVLGNEHLRQSGLIDYREDSGSVDRLPEEKLHWQHAEKLVICAHYPEEFFRDEIAIFRYRCENHKETEVILLAPNSPGTNYQKSVSGHEIPDIADKIERIEKILSDPRHVGEHSQCIKIFKHPCILRYSLVLTEDDAWINFFTNSGHFMTVPALKVQANTPFYQFLKADLDKLKTQAQ